LGTPQGEKSPLDTNPQFYLAEETIIFRKLSRKKAKLSLHDFEATKGDVSATEESAAWSSGSGQNFP
jgi:hypothetical protein